MCNACGFICCASDEMEACGCETCGCSACLAICERCGENGCDGMCEDADEYDPTSEGSF